MSRIFRDYGHKAGFSSLHRVGRDLRNSHGGLEARIRNDGRIFKPSSGIYSGKYLGKYNNGRYHDKYGNGRGHEYGK